MNIRRTLFFILAFSLLITGCSERDRSNLRDTSETEIPVMINQNQSLETQPPTTVSSIKPTSTPVASPTAAPLSSIDSPCEADKWEIIPIGLYEYSQSEGWKIVVIQIAVHNGSSYWGSLSVNQNALNQELILTTEGGFAYNTDRAMNNVYYLGDAQPGIPPADSPYEGHSVNVPSQVLSKILPPGFSYKGDYGVSMSGSLMLGGAPKSWQQLVFRVPETQKHFRVFFPSAKIDCFREDGQVISENKPPFEWDLDIDVRSINYPTDRPDSDFQEFVGFSVTKGQGIFTFTGSSKTDWREGSAVDEELDLFFSLENTNQGYDIEETLTVYAIGDDGIHRRAGCGSNTGCSGFQGRGEGGTYRVGPGQVIEPAIAFIVDPKVSNLKLVWIDTSSNFFIIFSLPDK